MKFKEYLNAVFALRENKTSIRTEVGAGIATFMTMAYIIFVNPAILSAAGVPYYPVTAPALIVVGFLTMKVISKIPWDDYTEALPAFLIILGIPFTYSISRGIGYGFITYTVLKLLTGRFRDVHPLRYVISILFALSFPTQF